MKKIIAGRKYDTSTADEIAYREWFDKSVSRHQEETFYRKKNGEFFRFDEKSTTWGNIENYQDIIPLTTESAQHYLAEILSVEEYEAIFGEVQE